MNRIRKINNGYQVLLTPNIKFSPDSSLMIGNWEDEELRNFQIIEFPTLQAAQCEAFKYPDIDWFKIIQNHKYIYERLKKMMKTIIDENDFMVEFVAKFMNAEEFKNVIFDRVENSGDRFSLKYGACDIISFIIINPWTNNLNKIAKCFETYRNHLHRDDLRLKYKKIIDNKTILLFGHTEFGTTYEIKIMPTLLYQWSRWIKKNDNISLEQINKLYNKYLLTQDQIDNSPVLL